MRIGIDFDNTIACYDTVFHTVALERGLIPRDLGTDKNCVRDYLNESGQKDAFTELQGYIYGARMDLVTLYPGVKSFLLAARASGHQLFLVSHKTRYPIRGPTYDMHAAALNFLYSHGLIGGAGGFAAADVFFELTKNDKVARAGALGCHVFIDDLPEILDQISLVLGPGADFRAILFDPSGVYPTEARFERLETWPEIARMLLGSSADVPA